MLTSLMFFVAFLVTVAVHEAGHFIAMWRFGHIAPVFSIGFGPEILSWTHTWSNGRRTKFVLGLLPLGGYVASVERRLPVHAFQRDHPIVYRILTLPLEASRLVLHSPLYLLRKIRRMLSPNRTRSVREGKTIVEASRLEETRRAARTKAFDIRIKQALLFRHQLRHPLTDLQRFIVCAAGPAASILFGAFLALASFSVDPEAMDQFLTFLSRYNFHAPPNLSPFQLVGATILVSIVCALVLPFGLLGALLTGSVPGNRETVATSQAVISTNHELMSFSVLCGLVGLMNIFIGGCNLSFLPGLDGAEMLVSILRHWFGARRIQTFQMAVQVAAPSWMIPMLLFQVARDIRLYLF